MAYEIFQSTRLMFRPVEEDEEMDATLLKIRSSPSFWNGDIALPSPGGKASAKEYREILMKHCTMALYICLLEMNVDVSTNQQAVDVATHKKQITIIGVITFSREGPDNHSHHAHASIGIELLPDHLGQGYGSEALIWMQNYAFTFARIHRITIQCVEWNKGALRLYQRLGWQIEGIAREAVWFMGSWHGLVSLGLLEHEWRAKTDHKQTPNGVIATIMDCE